jgi:hypothetical protein
MGREWRGGWFGWGLVGIGQAAQRARRQRAAAWSAAAGHGCGRHAIFHLHIRAWILTYFYCIATDPCHQQFVAVGGASCCGGAHYRS